jgi:rare lipoprotein A
VRSRMPARPLIGGALCLVTTGAVAVQAGAQAPAAPPAGPADAAVEPRVSVDARKLHVRAGERTSLRGRVLPAVAGIPVALQARRGDGWVTLDRGRTRASGRYRLRDRQTVAQSTRLRLRVRRGHGLRGRTRAVGRLNVYRYANASWYGPGLYGNRLGCGGTLGPGSVGVAHKTLPCGTKVSFRRNGRTMRVPVIDRGPYVAGREYDLTAATARKLRFHGHGAILATR